LRPEGNCAIMAYADAVPAAVFTPDQLFDNR
jgi:hypothetical protein